MRHIDRRTSILLVSGALITRIDIALGQTSTKYLGGDMVSAVELEQFAVEMSVEKDVLKFVEMHYHSRKKTIGDAATSGVFQDPEQAISDLRKSIDTKYPGLPGELFLKKFL